MSDKKKKSSVPAVMGQPRKFKTDEEFQTYFVEYIEDCSKKGKLPNISGFCVWCDIARETFYTQKSYYSDTYQKIRAALEDALVNHHLFGQKNPAMAIVQGKNTFKWDDKPQQHSDDSIQIDADDDDLDALIDKLGYKLLG